MPQHYKTIDTVYACDSIESLPSDRDVFVLGTYQLYDKVTQKFITPEEKADDESNVQRKGDLQIFKKNDEGWAVLSQNGVNGFIFSKKLFDVATEASLDIKWSYQGLGPNEDKFILGQSDAKGNLKLFEYHKEEYKLIPLPDSLNFPHLLESQKENLNLSLDWSNRLFKDNCQIACSFSDGSISINQVDPMNFQLQTRWRWLAHPLEAWIVAFNYFNTNQIFSGSDDGLLKSWDLRCINQWDEENSSLASLDVLKPSFTNKSHQAGVCSIQSNPHQEHYLLTGSYDETLRLFDLRNLRYPIQELNVGGGLWRIKWHPTKADHIAIAAMHGGFHIVYKDENNSILNLKESFNEHTSIAYGVDWGTLNNQHQFVYSGSFYDHKACIWSY